MGHRLIDNYKVGVAKVELNIEKDILQHLLRASKLANQVKRESNNNIQNFLNDTTYENIIRKAMVNVVFANSRLKLLKNMEARESGKFKFAEIKELNEILHLVRETEEGITEQVDSSTWGRYRIVFGNMCRILSRIPKAVKKLRILQKMELRWG